MSEASWVAVGVYTGGERKVRASEIDAETVKTFGPFDTPDEAREAVNLLGVADFTAWAVVPLRQAG